VAEALAARHGARVTALFGVRSDGVRASYAYSASAALGEAADPQAIEHDFERSRLRGLCDQNGAGFTWCEIFGDTVRHGFLAETAYVDLLILGQQTKADETSGAPAGFVESVILESGVPALVIPLLAWAGDDRPAHAPRLGRLPAIGPRHAGGLAIHGTCRRGTRRDLGGACADRAL